MNPTKKNNSCCGTSGVSLSDCKVDAIVSVDERGQMVLPKEIREQAGIKPGDKLALVSWTENGKVCCLSLMKIEELTRIVKDRLGPMMSEVLHK